MSDKPEVRFDKFKRDVMAAHADHVREIRRIETNTLAALGNLALTLRDQFLDRAAACEKAGELEKAEVWEEAAQLLTPLGLGMVPDVVEEEGKP
jgi:hypothetical protein